MLTYEVIMMLYKINLLGIDTSLQIIFYNKLYIHINHIKFTFLVLRAKFKYPQNICSS